MWLTVIVGALQALAGPLKFVAGEVRGWAERRDTLREATLQKELATITAQAELAAWKAKADVEWDLTWAGQAQTSWKDEFLLLLWTVPALQVIPAVFFEGYRANLMETLAFFQQLHPDIIQWYLAGWAVIFSATFGMKGATQMMLPGRLGSMVNALKGVEDDIPDDVADAATARIKAQLKAAKA